MKQACLCVPSITRTHHVYLCSRTCRSGSFRSIFVRRIRVGVAQVCASRGGKESMGFFNYLASRWDHILELAIAHAEVVFISLLIATAIGVTAGVLVYRRERSAE